MLLSLRVWRSLDFTGFVSHGFTAAQGHDPIATLAKAIEIFDV